MAGVTATFYWGYRTQSPADLPAVFIGSGGNSGSAGNTIGLQVSVDKYQSNANVS